MKKNYSLPSIEVNLPPPERFSQFLRSQGKRLTPQRRIILTEVFSHHDHFDADELIEHLRERIARREVSRPTVYRTLSELLDAGLLRKMTLNNRSVYEHDYGYPSHDHLHCDICNKLIEFHCGELERIRDAVAKEYGFQVRGHRLFVSGVCRECRENARKR